MLSFNDEEDAIKSLPKFDSVNSTQFINSPCESYLDSTMATTFSSTSAMTTSNDTNSFDSALPLTTDLQNHQQLTNDQSNLDFVDFIEVNNDLINIDQECAWYLHFFFLVILFISNKIFSLISFKQACRSQISTQLKIIQQTISFSQTKLKTRSNNFR